MNLAADSEKNDKRGAGRKHSDPSELKKLNRMRRRGGGMSLLVKKLLSTAMTVIRNDMLDGY